MIVPCTGHTGCPAAASAKPGPLATAVRSVRSHVDLSLVRAGQGGVEEGGGWFAVEFKTRELGAVAGDHDGEDAGAVFDAGCAGFPSLGWAPSGSRKPRLVSAMLGCMMAMAVNIFLKPSLA